jgi:hypothetical protein
MPCGVCRLIRFASPAVISEVPCLAANFTCPPKAPRQIRRHAPPHHQVGQNLLAAFAMSRLLLFVILLMLASGCDSGRQPKSANTNSQVLSSLESKAGVIFPTNTTVVYSGAGGGREPSHQFYEWAVYCPTPVTLPKMTAVGVTDYLNLPLKDTVEFVQSRMRTQRIVSAQSAFSTEWKSNGFGFSATIVRGTHGDYLVITQDKL